VSKKLIGKAEALAATRPPKREPKHWPKPPRDPWSVPWLFEIKARLAETVPDREALVYDLCFILYRWMAFPTDTFTSSGHTITPETLAMVGPQLRKVLERIVDFYPNGFRPETTTKRWETRVARAWTKAERLIATVQRVGPSIFAQRAHEPNSNPSTAPEKSANAKESS